jgi:hypothetical protein
LETLTEKKKKKKQKKKWLQIKIKNKSISRRSSFENKYYKIGKTQAQRLGKQRQPILFIRLDGRGSTQCRWGGGIVHGMIW